MNDFRHPVDPTIHLRLTNVVCGNDGMLELHVSAAPGSPPDITEQLAGLLATEVEKTGDNSYKLYAVLQSPEHPDQGYPHQEMLTAASELVEILANKVDVDIGVECTPTYLKRGDGMIYPAISMNMDRSLSPSPDHAFVVASVLQNRMDDCDMLERLQLVNSLGGVESVVDVEPKIYAATMLTHEEPVKTVRMAEMAARRLVPELTLGLAINEYVPQRALN